MLPTHFRVALASLAASALLAGPSQAQEPPVSNAAELAKKLSNPVADLISVPFQANWDYGIGSEDATRFTLNFQPVIPLTLSQDWNLITRTIVPFIDAEAPTPSASDESGLGDILQSFFFSPKAPSSGGWIWGVGPALLYPTASEDALGSEKWGAGPTFVALKQEHGWTYGALANHIWSFAGDDNRSDVSSTFLQPFVAHTFERATTLTLNTESTYDWEAEEWTVPINLMASQVLRIGKLPISLQVGGRHYADAPPGGPDWGLRFVLTFLFPR